MNEWIKKFGGWLPIIIVCISVFQKATFLSVFVSSIDDNLVASSIIYGKKPLNESKVRITLHDQRKPTYNSIPKELARKLDSTGYLMPVLRQLHFLFPLYAVPNETTYAPLQFFLTAFLVRDTQTMTSNLVMGRLPSLLVHFLGLMLFLYLMVKYFDGDKNTGSLCFSLLILSFSYEHLIYSIQMESYAIGVFAFFLLMLGYLRYLDKYVFKEDASKISIGIFCGLLMLMQYQLIFFSFAAVCSIIYFSIQGKVSYKSIAKRMIVSGIIFLLFFTPTYIMFLSKHTEHVAKYLIGNGTYASKFWFPGYKITGLLDGIVYFFRFFALNTLEVFRTMTYLFTPRSIAEKITFGLNLFFFTLGLIYVVKNRNSKYLKWMNIFIVFSCIIWLILIVSGRIALTPDRHSLILLPIFILFIYFGCARVGSYFEKNIFSLKYLRNLAVIAALCILLISANTFLSQRTEPVILAKINEQNIPSNSLIITNNRIFYLFSKETGIPIYLQAIDKSREGWLTTPIQSEIVPQRVYFINGSQNCRVADQKSQVESIDSSIYIPKEISMGNKLINNLLLSNNYKIYVDTVYTVFEDEINAGFIKKREERILVFNKK